MKMICCVEINCLINKLYSSKICTLYVLSRRLVLQQQASDNLQVTKLYFSINNAQQGCSMNISDVEEQGVAMVKSNAVLLLLLLLKEVVSARLRESDMYTLSVRTPQPHNTNQ